jgi:hypothetical protein
VPWPQQSFHQISSIKPCLVIGFLHHPKNLYIVPKSPPFEALNDFHAHFDLNVMSLSNIIIVANIIVDLEHELELLKLIVKKHKFVIGDNGFVSFIRWIVSSKVEGKEKLLIPKFDSLLKHLGRREAIFVMLRVKDEEFYGNKKCVHVKKPSFIHSNPS